MLNTLKVGLGVIALAGAAGVAPAAAEPPPLAPAEFVSLGDVDPSIGMDIRYATGHNFTGDPVDGYQAPMCILTRPAAEALQRAQAAVSEQGYSLKVYDCYRPQRAVNDFVAWANNPVDQRMKAEFYPRLDKTQLFPDGYIAEKSGHSRGDTVDLTLTRMPAEPLALPGPSLVDCAAPVSERFPDNSIDMGTGYDCFDTLAHTLDPRIQGEQLKNRLMLKDVLESHGFENYENEWWHFTYKPESFPETYFDFPVDPASLTS